MPEHLLSSTEVRLNDINKDSIGLFAQKIGVLTNGNSPNVESGLGKLSHKYQEQKPFRERSIDNCNENRFIFTEENCSLCYYGRPAFKAEL